jgi:hypothetical protein
VIEAWRSKEGRAEGGAKWGYGIFALFWAGTQIRGTGHGEKYCEAKVFLGGGGNIPSLLENTYFKSKYLNPLELHSMAVSKTRISWKFRRILGKLVSKNPVTIATNSIAILSSAFRRRELLLVGVGGSDVCCFN